MKDYDSLVGLFNEFETDPTVREFYKRRKPNGIFNVLKCVNDENRYSNFIEWILDGENSSGLGCFPAKLLLDFLVDKLREEATIRKYDVG